MGHLPVHYSTFASSITAPKNSSRSKQITEASSLTVDSQMYSPKVT